ncbi:MAG: hypothetical protein Q9M35_03415 [Rhodothermus sp.]|nr:hypothetical protein [Rhodothermus sp.]
MAIVTVPKVLREKLGEEGVEALVALLNEAAHHERNNLMGILEERFERRVTEEGNRMDRRVTEVEARLEQRITEVEAKLKQQIAEVEARLGERMAGMRADLIRWMFLFWVGQIGTLVAILWAFLR